MWKTRAWYTSTMQKSLLNKHFLQYGTAVFIVVLFGAVVVLGYKYYFLQKQTNVLFDDTTNLKNASDLQLQKLTLLENTLADTQDSLAIAGKQIETLLDSYNAISGTVGTLEKLSKIDARLLQKYSKVYFLNENYVPDALTQIDARYVLEQNRTYEFHAKAYSYLVRLLDAANAEGIPLRVASAYRSFSTQTALKAQYKVTFGSGANKFSADQGYSEHQLGTTVDFSTPSTGGNLTNFEKDKAYAWLIENAYRYGFVLSYPEGNAYYIFEPWHWPFVGVPLPGKLHRDGLWFYDMDQHDIDKYLITLFD